MPATARQEDASTAPAIWPLPCQPDPDAKLIEFTMRTQTGLRSVHTLRGKLVAQIYTLVTISPAEVSWANVVAFADAATMLEERFPTLWEVDIPGLDTMDLEIMRTDNPLERRMLLGFAIAQALNELGVSVVDYETFNLDRF